MVRNAFWHYALHLRCKFSKNLDSGKVFSTFLCLWSWIGWRKGRIDWALHLIIIFKSGLSIFYHKTSVGENIYHISQQRRNMHIMNGIRAGRFSSERGICQPIYQPYYSLNGLKADFGCLQGGALVSSVPTEQEDGLNGFLLLGKN